MKMGWLPKKGKEALARDLPVIYNVNDIIIFLAMNFGEFEKILPSLAIAFIDGFLNS